MKALGNILFGIGASIPLLTTLIMGVLMVLDAFGVTDYGYRMLSAWLGSALVGFVVMVCGSILQEKAPD